MSYPFLHRINIIFKGCCSIRAMDDIHVGWRKVANNYPKFGVSRSRVSFYLKVEYG